MKDYQNAVIKMITGTRKFFADRPELDNNNPVLKAHINTLDEYLSELMTNINNQQINITGNHIAKRKTKVELANLTYRLTAAMSSYAIDNDDLVLYAKVNKSVYGIIRLKDIRTPSYTNFVSNLLTKHKAELVDYGVTENDILELKAKIEDFEELYLLPSIRRKQKKIATEKIKSIISKILLLLRRSIDNDMMYYANSDTNVHDMYKRMRKINDSKTTPLPLIGKVTHQETGLPLQYVTVTIVAKNNDKAVEQKTITTKKGNYRFKKLDEGINKITFDRSYYNILNTEVVIIKNSRTRLNVSIEKEVGS